MVKESEVASASTNADVKASVYVEKGEFIDSRNLATICE